jgi:hypothetical protein
MSRELKIQAFDDKQVRIVWDDEEQKYYFSVTDVVGVLTDQPDARGASTYWAVLKKRLKQEGANELITNCKQLKLPAADGKNYSTDVADTERLLRIIQSIPSKKAGCSYTLLSRGIFTADNKWSFVTYERSNTIGWEDCSFEDCKYYYTIKIQTEDGETLATLSTNAFCEDLVTLVKVENAYKLLVKNNTKYDFYSLPGNGETQDIETPAAPRKSARKVLKKDQVYIESPDHIYDTQGKMVR